MVGVHKSISFFLDEESGRAEIPTHKSLVPKSINIYCYFQSLIPGTKTRTFECEIEKEHFIESYDSPPC